MNYYMNTQEFERDRC